MRFKKILGVGVAAVMATTMLSGLTACGSSKETITIWCSEVTGVAEQMEEQLEQYVEEYEANSGEEFAYQFDVVGVSESTAASNMITDVSAGADIFCFAQDQLSRLVEAGALASVSSTYVSLVEANNDAGSVSAGTVGSTVYAYPLTSDNGYFVYYDKTVITDESVLENQTELIAACKAANKTIAFQLSEDGGWYNAAYFFGAGCVSNWTFSDTGSVESYYDTYNTTAGVTAVKGMAELINSGYWVNSSSASAFEGTSAVLVSGTWSYNDVVTALGGDASNVGCCKLWEYTVDGTDYQLGSFSGYKLMGVKPQSDTAKLAACHAVAYYLTGQECQAERFDSFAWGPSNTTVQASDAVQSNIALAALSAQNEYSTPQGQYPDAWWTAAATIGASVSALGTTSPADSDCQTILKTYDDTLYTIANPTFVGWVAVGDLSEASWDTMAEAYELTYENNTYANKSESAPYTGIWTITLTIAEVDWDSGFRFCIYGGWTATDEAYGIAFNTSGLGYSEVDAANTSVTYSEGGDNNILLAAGTYTVMLDTTGSTAVITIN